MKSTLRILIPVLVFFMVFSLAGCARQGDQEKGASDAKKDSPKEGKDAIDKFKGLKVRHGDKVILNFTVKTPAYLYLNGPKPVRVMVPGNSPFKFSKNEYFVTKPVFPIKIEFSVPKDTPTGRQKITFGLRLMYCNKADDVCLIKNEIMNFELWVMQSIPDGFKTHAPEKIYKIE